jgi:hypothetical protein
LDTGHNLMKKQQAVHLLLVTRGPCQMLDSAMKYRYESYLVIRS